MSIVKSRIPGPPNTRVGIGIVFNTLPTSRISRPDNPQILITQRRPNTPYAGYWEFPGGKALPDEPIHACITRELREELDIQVEITTTLPRVIHTYQHATVDLTPAIARLTPDSPAPRAIDVADWRWCPLNDLPWDTFLPANARIVTRITRFLADENAP